VCVHACTHISVIELSNLFSHKKVTDNEIE